MKEKFDVAIIGAGLAGLSCATELKRNKIDFHIFESSDQVGGRVRSDFVDEDNKLIPITKRLKYNTGMPINKLIIKFIIISI